MDNYQIARDRAQAYFLNFDQAVLISRWDLRHDASFLYVHFLGREYAVDRSNGSITRLFDGTQAGFSEVLSIFDLLCHQGKDMFLTGRYAPVNSLDQAPKTGGVGTDFHGKLAAVFDRDLPGLHAACRALGGRQVDMGDVGYAFKLFDVMEVILKFYRADEDFPATITLLWDENMLHFIHYETVFYIAGFLLQSIEMQMRSLKDARNEA